MSEWVPMPEPPLIWDRREPYLVLTAEVKALTRYLTDRKVTVGECAIGEAATTAETISGLKEALPFPRWCGLSWDSVADAFEDVREALQTPFALLITGLPALRSKHEHLSMEFVIRTAEFERAFLQAGDQFTVLYVSDAWS